MKRLSEYKDSDFKEIEEYDLLRKKYFSIGSLAKKDIYAKSIESLLSNFSKQSQYIISMRCVYNKQDMINMGVKRVVIYKLFDLDSKEEEEKEFINNLIHLDKRDYDILYDIITSNNRNFEIAGIVIGNELYFDEQLYYIYLKRTEEENNKIIENSEYKWLGKLSRKGLRNKKLNKISFIEKVQTIIVECKIREVNVEVSNEEEIAISKSNIKNLNIKTDKRYLNLVLLYSSVETINLDLTGFERNKFPIKFRTDWKLGDSSVKNITLKIKESLWDGKEVDISSIMRADNVSKETNITIITE